MAAVLGLEHGPGAWQTQQGQQGYDFSKAQARAQPMAALVRVCVWGGGRRGGVWAGGVYVAYLNQGGGACLDLSRGGKMRQMRYRISECVNE